MKMSQRMRSIGIYVIDRAVAWSGSDRCSVAVSCGTNGLHGYRSATKGAICVHSDREFPPDSCFDGAVRHRQVLSSILILLRGQYVITQKDTPKTTAECSCYRERWCWMND